MKTSLKDSSWVVDYAELYINPSIAVKKCKLRKNEKWKQTLENKSKIN